jgi:hypothetical protein
MLFDGFGDAPGFRGDDDEDTGWMIAKCQQRCAL